MHEILKKLFEAQVLSEETKSEITEAWDVMVQKFTEDKTAEIKTELVEQFVAEREELTAKVEEFIQSRLDVEIAELKEDIAKYQDLEVQYAEKLVEEKQGIAVKLAEEIDSLVDKLDTFLEERFEAELAELEEDLKEAQKAQLGKKIFEAFKSEFSQFAKTDEAALESQIARLEDTVSNLKESLAKSEEEKTDIVRESKLEQILAPLSGVKREQMSILLSNVATEKLEESYGLYISKVLKEEKTEDQSTVITESAKAKVATTIATGDVVITEEHKEVQPSVNADAIARMRELAGLK